MPIKVQAFEQKYLFRLLACLLSADPGYIDKQAERNCYPMYLCANNLQSHSAPIPHIEGTKKTPTVHALFPPEGLLPQHPSHEYDLQAQAYWRQY